MTFRIQPSPSWRRAQLQKDENPINTLRRTRMRNHRPNRKPKRSASQRPSRQQATLPLWLRLLRKPLHVTLIALLLAPPPHALAAIAPAGGGGGPRERADLAPSAELRGGAPGGAEGIAATGDASEGTPRDTVALSAKEAASGLEPDLEALIQEEEKTEHREAQAGSSASDGGSGGGAAPLGGGAAAPRVDLHTGGARLEVAIQIPPGRRDATPRLKLIYSSSAGDSPWGFGWDLPIGHISRSTKWGVPTCPLNQTDTKPDFVLNLNGSALELKRIFADSHFYRPRISETYFEIWAQTGTRNYWEVFDRAGNKYVFGDVPAARIHSGVDTFYDTRYNATTGANCNFTTQWMLTKFVSPNGNEIIYTYSKDVGNNATYLRYIDYGGNGSNPSLREAPFRIIFDGAIANINRDRGTPLGNPSIHPWAPAPRSISYARGVLVRRYWLIIAIRVMYRPRPGAGHQLIREYKLDHRDDPYTGRSFLQRVRILDPTGKELAPPQTFEYASSQLDFAREYGVAGPLVPTDIHRLHYTTRKGHTIRKLEDVNGDGYVDLIDSWSNGWVRLGTANGITGPTFTWTGGFNRNSPLATEKLSRSWRHGVSRFSDFTGDGIPEKLAKKEENWEFAHGACAKTTQCNHVQSTYRLAQPGGWLELTRTKKRQTWLRRTLMDWDADGIPDFVRADASPRWQVHRGTGTSFQRIPIQGRHTFPEIEYREKHGNQWITHRMTRDVNGDGLPDHLLFDRNTCVTFDLAGNPTATYTDRHCGRVYAANTAAGVSHANVVYTNRVQVWLNSGRGFDHQITWHIPYAGGASPSEEMVLRREIERQGTIQDLRDVNGDGLPDFVLVVGGRWQVVYNQGGVIDYSQNPHRWLTGGSWIRQTTEPARGNTSVAVELFDMDGDGLPELVNAWNMFIWKVRKLRAPNDAPLIRPGLLVRSRNGLGGSVRFHYRPSTRYDNTDTRGAPRLPQIRWVVSSMSQVDDQCRLYSPYSPPCFGQGVINYYSYKGGLYDATSREFRGFREVTVTDAASNDRKYYFSQADTTRGKLLREEQYLRKRLLSKTSYVWRTQQSHRRTQIYLAEQKQEEFDFIHGGAFNRCLLTRNQPPDDIGRLTTTCSLSCSGAPATPGSCANPVAGQVDTITKWVNPNPTSWVRERPSHVLTRYKNAAGALETLVDKWFYYDGSGADGLPAGQVLQGNVKRVVTKLDRSFAGPVANPIVRNEYGLYGNLMGTVDPNGRRTVNDYRGSPFQLYPRVRRNALGHTTTTVTDLRYGQPTSVTDANGQTTQYRYDALGRLICVAMPLDQIAGCGGTGPFTRSAEYRYVYGNPKATTERGKFSYVEERQREPWADGNAASHSAGDYVAARRYIDALGRFRYEMHQRVIGNSTGAVQWVVEGHTRYNKLSFPDRVYVPYVLSPSGEPPRTFSYGGYPHTRYDYRFNGGQYLDPLGRPHRIRPPDKHPITAYYMARRTDIYQPAPGSGTASVRPADAPVVALPAGDSHPSAAFSPEKAPLTAAPSAGPIEAPAALEEPPSAQREARRAEDLPEPPDEQAGLSPADLASSLPPSGPAPGPGSGGDKAVLPSPTAHAGPAPSFAALARVRGEHPLVPSRAEATPTAPARPDAQPPQAGDAEPSASSQRSGAQSVERVRQPTSGLLRAVTGFGSQLRRWLSRDRPASSLAGRRGLVLRPAASPVGISVPARDWLQQQNQEEIRRAQRRGWERYYREGRFRCLAYDKRSKASNLWTGPVPSATGLDVMLFFRTFDLNALDRRESACRAARRAAREAAERAAREARERRHRESVARAEAELRGTGASRNGIILVEDDFGRVTYKGYYEPVGTDKLGIYYRYDGLGRLLRTELLGSPRSAVNFRYDTLGRLIEIRDPNLGVGPHPGRARLGYDAAGNMIYRDTPVSGQRIQWCYDALHRLTARFLQSDGDAYVASLCSNSATAESRFTYDSATAGPYHKGRLARVDDAAGYLTTVFDARGRTVRQTRSSPGPGGPRGGTQTFSLAYDLAGRVTAMTYPDGEVVRYRYNRVGQVVSMAGTGTYLKDLQYDFLGRPDLITHGNGTTAQPVVDDFAYHGAGENFRLREIHTKKGATSYYRTSYAYQERGKIAKITDHLRSTGPLSSTQSYRYDGLGRVVTADWLANGRTTDAYDAAYAFDRVGNLTQKGSLRGALQLRYHATRPHQLASYGPRGTEHDVVYDAAGRMASRVVKTGATPAAAESESYFYDPVHRLSRVVVHTGTGLYRTGAAQTSTTRYWYDPGGDRVRTQVTDAVTNATSTTHHFFPQVEWRDGQMTKYYFAGGLRIAGRIATPSVAGAASDVLAGARFRGIELAPSLVLGLAFVLLLLLFSPGLRGRSPWPRLLVPTRIVATAAFFSLALLPPGLAKAALPGNVTLWHYHLDHIGTTHSITDASGNLYRQTRTTPYGEVRGRYDGSGNVVTAEPALRHEFTGYQSEEKSGLQYAGSRYYVPELGVFTSHDPQAQFPNSYSYGGGDPVNGSDPDGEFFWEIIKALVSFFINLFKTGDVKQALNAASMQFAASITDRIVSTLLQDVYDPIIHNVLGNSVERAGQGYSDEVSTAGQHLAQIAAQVGHALVESAYALLNSDSGRSRQQIVSGSPPTAPDSVDADEEESIFVTIFRHAVFDYKEPLGGSLLLEALSSVPVGRVVKAGRTVFKIAKKVRGGRRPVEIGKEGERLAGITKPKKRVASATGTAKHRYPDEVTDDTLREVKNVKKLTLKGRVGDQLRDYAEIAKRGGKDAILIIRKGAASEEVLGELKKLGFDVRQDLP